MRLKFECKFCMKLKIISPILAHFPVFLHFDSFDSKILFANLNGPSNFCIRTQEMGEILKINVKFRWL